MTRRFWFPRCFQRRREAALLATIAATNPGSVEKLALATRQNRQTLVAPPRAESAAKRYGLCFWRQITQDRFAAVAFAGFHARTFGQVLFGEGLPPPLLPWPSIARLIVDDEW